MARGWGRQCGIGFSMARGWGRQCGIGFASGCRPIGTTVAHGAADLHPRARPRAERTRSAVEGAALQRVREVDLASSRDGVWLFCVRGRLTPLPRFRAPFPRQSRGKGSVGRHRRIMTDDAKSVQPRGYGGGTMSASVTRLRFKSPSPCPATGGERARGSGVKGSTARGRKRATPPGDEVARVKARQRGELVAHPFANPRG